jgi:hypothetical protein
MSRLTDMLELRELHTSNLEACTSAYAELCDLITAVEEGSDNSMSRSSFDLSIYDHSTCQDCSIIHTMATQCVDHLSHLLKQQEEVRASCDALTSAKMKIEEAKIEINRVAMELRNAPGGAELFMSQGSTGSDGFRTASETSSESSLRNEGVHQS